MLVAVVQVTHKDTTKGCDDRCEALRKAVVIDVKKVKESVTGLTRAVATLTPSVDFYSVP